MIELPVELHLVKLDEGASSEDALRVLAHIKESGGQVASVIRGGDAIIAAFKSQVADELRLLPHIKLVGGISLKDREIPVIRRQLTP